MADAETPTPVPTQPKAPETPEKVPAPALARALPPEVASILESWRAEFFPENSNSPSRPVKYLSGEWHFVHRAIDVLKSRLTLGAEK